MLETLRDFSFFTRHARVAQVLASAALCGGLVACVTPYHPEVVQGNFVSREQVQALRPGMPRQVVRDILGTPLVTSLFHDQRWDYAFTIRRQGAEPQQRRFTVFFSGDVLERIEGDPLPTEAEFAARLDTRRPPTKLPQLKADEAELAKISVKKSSPETTAVPAPTGPVSYPPLENAAR